MKEKINFRDILDLDVPNLTGYNPFEKRDLSDQDPHPCIIFLGINLIQIRARFLEPDVKIRDPKPLRNKNRNQSPTNEGYRRQIVEGLKLNFL